MIYIYKTLWAILGIPVWFISCFAFGISLLTYPLISLIYYTIYRRYDMKWEVDTIADFIYKKYYGLKHKIKKYNGGK